MKFQKGWKGGPGRPKGWKTPDWFREFADGEGKQRLIKWARSKNSKASMQALTLIYHYAYGKPKETHEVSGSVTIGFEVLEQARARAGFGSRTPEGHGGNEP